MSPDAIATTVASALLAGAVSHAADAPSHAIAEGYEGLHSLLRARYSHHHEAIDALEQLEDRPWSEGRRLVLAEELRVVDIASDTEVVCAVQSLMSLLRAFPGLPGSAAPPQSVHATGNTPAHKNQAV